MHMKETYNMNVVKLEWVAFAKIPYEKRQLDGFKSENLAYYILKHVQRERSIETSPPNQARLTIHHYSRAA